MPRVAAIFGISAVLLFCCGCLTSVFAQPREPEVARKFDEFGKVGHCDLTARLDNLAITVRDTPGVTAHLISYAPPGVGERLLELIKEYLVNTRGLEARQIGTTYGGRNSDLTQAKIELWIVPHGAPPPEPVIQKTNVETFKGLLANEQVWDDFGVEVEADMGPGIGDTSRASFGDVLDQQKNAIGYLVVYSGDDATPGSWRRIAQNQIDYLKQFGVDSSRVKVVFGGHKKVTKLQLWILPKDAPPPVRDAGPERPLAKTVKVQDFSAYDLGKEQNQTNLFTRLKETLDTQKTVRAFLVVRLEMPTPVVDDSESALVNDEPVSEPVEEYQPADLTKLVEKWRVELANTHKIGADRFIVLFTTARESESSQLSLWLVPKGQPLPDPNEEEEPAEDESPGVKKP